MRIFDLFSRLCNCLWCKNKPTLLESKAYNCGCGEYVLYSEEEEHDKVCTGGE